MDEQMFLLSNEMIAQITPKIKSVELEGFFNLPFDSLPNTVEEIILNCNYQPPIVLPDFIKSFKLRYYNYQQKITFLNPRSIKSKSII